MIVAGVINGFYDIWDTAWVDIRNGICLLDKIEVFVNLQEDEQLISKERDNGKPYLANAMMHRIFFKNLPVCFHHCNRLIMITQAIQLGFLTHFL